MIAQFTEHTSAIKIRGRAEVLTKHGRISGQLSRSVKALANGGL